MMSTKISSCLPKIIGRLPPVYPEKVDRWKIMNRFLSYPTFFISFFILSTKSCERGGTSRKKLGFSDGRRGRRGRHSKGW